MIKHFQCFFSTINKIQGIEDVFTRKISTQVIANDIYLSSFFSFFDILFVGRTETTTDKQLQIIRLIKSLLSCDDFEEKALTSQT